MGKGEGIMDALIGAKAYDPLDWLQSMAPNHASVLLILRETNEFWKIIAFDEMARQAMLMHPVPDFTTVRSLTMEERAKFPFLPGHKPRPLQDTDELAILEFFQKAGMRSLSPATVHEALKSRASERKFHPVRDYLNGLTWDGRDRLQRWLVDYLGAEASTYIEEIGPMILVAAVARIFRPGCKADYMLVLEGPQGARKSSACRVLGGLWYDDNMPDLTNEREAAQHLRGKWIVEMAEMSAMGRAENQRLKAFLTRQVERFRPPYGRNEVVEERMCVFIGTTNQDVYLRDETGGRRYWPVKVGEIDTDALAEDRDQLFAEAVAKFKQGFRWWPDGDFERERIMPQQEARREADAWEDDVRAYLGARDVSLVSEVARYGLQIEGGRLGTSEQRRIAAVMLTMGWQRRPVDREGKRWWSRPGLSAEDYKAAVLKRRRAAGTSDSGQRMTAHASYIDQDAEGVL